MPRLRMLDKSEVAEEDLDIFGAGLHLHRLTLHSPRLARLSRETGLYFRHRSRLDPRLRELAILQVAQRMGSDYEYSHHRKIATDMGLSEADLSAVEETCGDELDSKASAVLRAAREIASGADLSDATFGDLGFLPEEQLVDLVFLISFYCGFVRFTTALRIPVEPDYLKYLGRRAGAAAAGPCDAAGGT